MSWTEFPLDGTTAMLLDQIAPTPDPFDQLERIGTWEKVIAWAQAHQCAESSGSSTTPVPRRPTG